MSPTIARRLVQVGRGLSVKEIATSDDVSENTVKTQLRNLYSTVGINDRMVLRRAFRNAAERCSCGHAAPLVAEDFAADVRGRLGAGT